MSYLIPGWELSEEKKSQYRQRIQEVMLSVALPLGIATSREQLTFRKIEAGDLGLTSWHISTLSCCVPRQQVFGIYKISSLDMEPQATSIKIFRDDMCLFTADLCEMYAGLNLVKALYHSSIDEIRVTEKLLGHETSDIEKFMGDKDLRTEAYLSEPIIFQPTVRLEIKTEPANHDLLVLVGFVLEPSGITTI